MLLNAASTSKTQSLVLVLAKSFFLNTTNDADRVRVNRTSGSNVKRGRPRVERRRP